MDIRGWTRRLLIGRDTPGFWTLCRCGSRLIHVCVYIRTHATPRYTFPVTIGSRRDFGYTFITQPAPVVTCLPLLFPTPRSHVGWNPVTGCYVVVDYHVPGLRCCVVYYTLPPRPVDYRYVYGPHVTVGRLQPDFVDCCRVYIVGCVYPVPVVHLRCGYGWLNHRSRTVDSRFPGYVYVRWTLRVGYVAFIVPRLLRTFIYIRPFDILRYPTVDVTTVARSPFGPGRCLVLVTVAGLNSPFGLLPTTFVQPAALR